MRLKLARFAVPTNSREQLNTNKTSINMKKTNFNQDNFGVVFKLSILFGKFHFIFLIFLVARMNSDYRQGLHMVH